ncbi:hypothetical protein [uncultured Pontibacter sp.]|uniref:hypothetical protein n=1 Tax=uncultured Pontibacter sp. TaxID=453356 RepID=UPI0026180229|nr:hypothetical protein [uncultured Pontibacter sp.]
MFKNSILALIVALGLLSCQQQVQQTSGATQAQAPENKVYYPGKGDNWEKKSPEELGLDATLLQQAVEWAKTQETTQIQKDFSTQKRDLW